MFARGPTPGRAKKIFARGPPPAAKLSSIVFRVWARLMVAHRQARGGTRPARTTGWRPTPPRPISATGATETVSRGPRVPEQSSYRYKTLVNFLCIVYCHTGGRSAHGVRTGVRPGGGGRTGRARVRTGPPLPARRRLAVRLG